ncbi:MAG: trehalose-phosphatase [Mycobacteriales bacterium]
MPEPVTAAGRAGLAALINTPRTALVALDFDGTLAPIVPRPEDARPLPTTLAVLRTLGARFGQVAIVTGRPVEWLVDEAGLGEVPGLIIDGQYGAQHWEDGQLREAEPAPGLAAVREQLPALVEGRQARIEDKRLSIVVHTRGADHPEAELAALAAPVRALADRHGLVAHPGRNVVEIRPPEFDKGSALSALVEQYDPATVVFIGDDVGDLAAFDVVDSLRAQGRHGLTVCSASSEVTQVAGRADLVVDGPPGVLELLTALGREVG